MENLAKTLIVVTSLSLPSAATKAFSPERRSEIPAFIDCSPEDRKKIRQSQVRLDDHLDAIFTEVAITCDTNTNAPCPSAPELMVIQAEVQRLIWQAQVLCRNAHPEWIDTLEVNHSVLRKLQSGGKNYGFVARFPDEATDDPGAYLLTTNTLDQLDPCLTQKAITHELSHLGSRKLHDLENRNDWIYLVGKIAETECRNTLNQE